MKISVVRTLLASALLAATLAGCGDEKKWDHNPATLEEEKVKHAIDHLLIREIAYGGSLAERNGKMWSYDNDFYLTICNPSLEVKYIDGMVLAMCAFPCDTKQITYTWDEEGKKPRISSFPAAKVYQFPGKGTDYPIAPGDSIVVAYVALDHRKPQGSGEFCLVGGMENSYDLSGATFQWWTSRQITDENVDVVPNKPSLICVFQMDNDNYVTYPSNAEKFIFDPETMIVLASFDRSKVKSWRFYQTTRYSDVNAGTHHQQKLQACMALPLESIVDAVMLSPTDQFLRSNVSPKLDKGRTSVHKMPNEEASLYAGKAVIRRHDGRNYVDVNNSTTDFQVLPASLSKKK